MSTGTIDMQTESVETQVDYSAHEANFLRHLEEKGMIVKPRDDYQREVATVASQATKNAHDAWEAKMQELTGKAKPEGVKGLDWITGALKPETPAPAPSPVVASNPKPANSVENDKKSAEFEALRTKVAQLEQERESERVAASQFLINKGLEASISKLNLKAENEQDLEEAKMDALHIIKGRYEIKVGENQQLVVYRSGNVVTDPETQKAITLDKLVKQQCARLIAPDKPAVVSGSGIKPDLQVQTAADGTTYIKAKSVGEIHDYIVEKLGHTKGSPEYNAFYIKSKQASSL